MRKICGCVTCFFPPISNPVAGWVLVSVALVQVPIWFFYATFMKKGDTCREVRC